MTELTADFVTFDKDSNELVIYLVEDGPWPVDEDGWSEVLHRIQERILAAVDVALTDELSARFPRAKPARVRVQVDSPAGVPSQLQDLVSAVRQFLVDDPDYRQAIGANNQSVRLVTGHELGRFRKAGGAG